jgi:hypothetical protein
VGRRAGDRESQKTCRLSRIVNNGKVAGSRYEDTEPLEVKESWVQALSLQKDSRLFLFNIETWSLVPGQIAVALLVKIASFCGGFSVQVSVCGLSFLTPDPPPAEHLKP